MLLVSTARMESSWVPLAETAATQDSYWIDSAAVDSKGNVYTGEVEDRKRIQKFVPVTSGRKGNR